MGSSLSYILRLIIVVGVLLWLYASWVYEKPANISELKQASTTIFTSAKSAALDVAKKEIEKDSIK